MALTDSGNFLDYIRFSAKGASDLYSSANANKPDGSASGNLTYIDDTSSARGGGKSPPVPGGGGSTETVTDIYITGQDSNLAETEQAQLDSEQYNIEIQFVGAWSDELKAVFEACADYLTSLIGEDIPDAVDGNGTIYDDLVITADLDAIDGVGGVLGQAGPTGIRSDTGLTAVGVMTFDEDDAQAYFESGQFDDIVLHEMMHVMGFGTLWDYKNLVSTEIDDNGTKKPTDDTITSVYNGDAANSAYFGYLPEDDFLFVETDGGSGTAGGHWDEETYKDELMTGYIGHFAEDGTYDATNYLSDWSVAALSDLGYVLTDGATGITDNVLLG